MDLKQAISIRRKLSVKIRILKQQLMELQEAIHNAEEQNKANDVRVEELKKSELIVTDHALIRYLERKKNFDTAKVRAEILTPQVRATIQQLGSGIMKVPGTKIKLVFDNYSIITIYEED